MDPLKELQSVSVEQRIALVETDITTGKDRYGKIPAHELALVLGIGDSRHPGGDWSFTRYVERVSVEEYVERRVENQLYGRPPNGQSARRFLRFSLPGVNRTGTLLCLRSTCSDRIFIRMGFAVSLEVLRRRQFQATTALAADRTRFRDLLVRVLPTSIADRLQKGKWSPTYICRLPCSLPTSSALLRSLHLTLPRWLWGGVTKDVQRQLEHDFELGTYEVREIKGKGKMETWLLGGLKHKLANKAICAINASPQTFFIRSQEILTRASQINP